MDGLNSDFEIGSKIRMCTFDDVIFEGILQYWDKSSDKGKLVLNNGNISLINNQRFILIAIKDKFASSLSFERRIELENCVHVCCQLFKL
jgi:hypothetical protein